MLHTQREDVSTFTKWFLHCRRKSTTYLSIRCLLEVEVRNSKLVSFECRQWHNISGHHPLLLALTSAFLFRYLNSGFHFPEYFTIMCRFAPFHMSSVIAEALKMDVPTSASFCFCSPVCTAYVSVLKLRRKFSRGSDVSTGSHTGRLCVGLSCFWKYDLD